MRNFKNGRDAFVLIARDKVINMHFSTVVCVMPVSIKKTDSFVVGTDFISLKLEVLCLSKLHLKPLPKCVLYPLKCGPAPTCPVRVECQIDRFRFRRASS